MGNQEEKRRPGNGPELGCAAIWVLHFASRKNRIVTMPHSDPAQKRARRNLPAPVALLLVIAIALIGNTGAQSQQRKFPLSKFDNTGCTSKGRVQECSGAVMQEILAKGKSSIPILITQLTDTGLTTRPIEDYWGHTSSGDIAYIVLTDLFTDADWKTFNMPGVPDWPAIMKACDSYAEACWREYVRKHGRKFIQRAWLRAWNQWKDQIYWEPTAQCFRISKK